MAGEEGHKTVYTITEEELAIIQAVRTAYDNAVIGGFQGTPFEWFTSITNSITPD